MRTIAAPGILIALLLLAGCPDKSDEPAAPEAPVPAASETPAALEKLPLDPAITPWTKLPDRSEHARKRTPWDNFAMDDPLAEKFRKEGLSAPFPRKWTSWEAYKADFTGQLLRKGKVDFTVVDGLYRGEMLGWQEQKEVVALLQAEVDAEGGDPSQKANFITGLIHIGFDDDALAIAQKYAGEEWFKNNWDVNFYIGALHFRYRRYAEAIPFLERAEEIHPDPWARIWLMLALTSIPGEEAAQRRKALFDYGPHMGSTDATGFPFRDIADSLGIRRWHLAGALSFLDINNDSYLDFVANGVWASPELYMFRPGEGYVLTGDHALQEISNTPPGSVAADFNNDGWTDLFMTRAAWLSGGPNRLLENNKGQGFVDRSSLGDVALPFQNSCGATALDFDRDGLVDLAVTGTSGGTIRLLRNEGGFVFRDVTKAAGLQELTAITIGVAAGDVNNDGWTDLFVNSVSPREGEEFRPWDPTGLPSSRRNLTPDALYINQQDGTFVNKAVEAGVQFGTPVGFASWMFDYDNDGDLDIFAANFVENPDHVLEGFQKPRDRDGLYKAAALYQNDGEGRFKDVGAEVGFIPASIMGATYLDFDLDGDLDVVQGPGRHALENAQPLFIYRNDGGTRFTNITPLDNPHFFGKFHGMASADLDRDGDPELYVNNGGVLLSDRWRDMVLENTTQGKRWIHLRLEGTKSNRSAIGSRVTVRVGERTLMQEVAAGQGFSSTNSPYLIFGLDEAPQVDGVTIRWTNGDVQELPALAADQALVVKEGSPDLRRVY